MKKLIAKLLVAVLSIVFWGNDTHGEIITLITTEAKNFDSDPIDVEEGQVLKVLHLKKSNQFTVIKVLIDDTEFRYSMDQDGSGSGSEFVFLNTYTQSGGSGYAVAVAAVPLFSNLIFQGPLKFSISSKSGPSLVTVEVTSNDYGASSGNNVTVIPNSAEDTTLVLEGSDDMVNWTVETLGDKPKATRKKFYRLRAKKE